MQIAQVSDTPSASRSTPADMFWGRERWPLPYLALSALVDLGMSDDAIAQYCAVESQDVDALRERYGLQRIKRRKRKALPGERMFAGFWQARIGL